MAIKRTDRTLDLSASPALAMPDPTTQSNYLDISSTHVALDWAVNWNEKCITGSVTHSLVTHTDQVDRAV